MLVRGLAHTEHVVSETGGGKDLPPRSTPQPPPFSPPPPLSSLEKMGLFTPHSRSFSSSVLHDPPMMSPFSPSPIPNFEPPLKLPQIQHLPHISFGDALDHCSSPQPRRKQVRKARPRRRSGDLSGVQDLSKPPPQPPTPAVSPPPAPDTAENLSMKRPNNNNNNHHPPTSQSGNTHHQTLPPAPARTPVGSPHPLGEIDGGVNASRRVVGCVWTAAKNEVVSQEGKRARYKSVLTPTLFYGCEALVCLEKHESKVNAAVKRCMWGNSYGQSRYRMGAEGVQLQREYNRACMTRCMDVVEAKGECKDREGWRKLVRMDQAFQPRPCRYTAQFLAYPLRELRDYCSPVASLVLTDSSQLTSDSQHLLVAWVSFLFKPYIFHHRLASLAVVTSYALQYNLRLGQAQHPVPRPLIHHCERVNPHFTTENFSTMSGIKPGTLSLVDRRTTDRTEPDVRQNKHNLVSMQPPPSLKTESEESQLPDNCRSDMHTPERDRERLEYCNSAESLSLPPHPPVSYLDPSAQLACGVGIHNLVLVTFQSRQLSVSTKEATGLLYIPLYSNYELCTMFPQEAAHYTTSTESAQSQISHMLRKSAGYLNPYLIHRANAATFLANLAEQFTLVRRKSCDWLRARHVTTFQFCANCLAVVQALCVTTYVHYILDSSLDNSNFPHLSSMSALSLTPPHSKSSRTNLHLGFLAVWIEDRGGGLRGSSFVFSLDSPLGFFPGMEACRNPLLNDLPESKNENHHIMGKRKMGRPKGQHSAPRGGPPRSWTNAELTEALQHVWNKKMTTSQASRIFGIPYNSLLMYVRGKYGKSLKLEQLKKDCLGGPGGPLDLLGLGPLGPPPPNINNNNATGKSNPEDLLGPPGSEHDLVAAMGPGFNPYSPASFYPDFAASFPVPVSMIHLLPQSEKNRELFPPVSMPMPLDISMSKDDDCKNSSGRRSREDNSSAEEEHEQPPAREEAMQLVEQNGQN
uniref:(California timema) hypothetical protein n=1 Tax=Timema californicum TaxID=61474 RepID=A0A7R9JC32_TIMCA|nr:unnamed protein product [Timema californicum]